MSPTKPLLRALAHQVVSPPPVWLMRQAGRYLPEYRALRAQAGSFLDLCYNPALAAEVTLQPVRRFGLDAAILFSDILVVPHGLGVDVSFVEGEGPKLAPVRTDAEVAALSVTAMTTRLAPVYETVGRVAGALPADVALIGFAGAPWTVATYMVEGGGSRDFAAVKRWALGAPESFARLIDVLVEATVAHLVAQVEAGAEAVQVFESWAGALPADAFERWCIAPMRRVVEGVRAACPGVPVIGFARGAGLLLERYASESGVDAVGLDSLVPTAWAASRLQPRVCVQGNLDPMYLLAGGEAMTAAAGRALRDLAGGAHVFNLGHGVVPATDPEEVARLVAFVRASA